MPTFIKTGFWEKVAKGYKGWLNLDDLIHSIANTSSSSSSFPTAQKETEVFNNVTLAGVSIPAESIIYSNYLLFPNLTSIIYDIHITPSGGDYNFLQLLDFPNLETVNGNVNINSQLRALNIPKLSFVKHNFQFSNNSIITSLDLPSLITVGNDPYGDGVYIHDCSDISTINLSNLTTVIGLFNIVNLSSLYTINLSSLESVQGNISISNCGVLNTINLPNLNNFNPPSAPTFRVNDNALTETCINTLLAKLVELAEANITLDWEIFMDGGTNAAPSGQGILDAAILESKGCSVITN
jgi:hypothetical protein